MHPILLDLGFFKLPSYGVMMALAFALGIYYLYKYLAKSGLAMTQDQLLSIATFVIVFSMVGARTFYVIQYWPDFNGDWAAVFLLKQREGFVFYGGLIFALAYLLWYCWQYKVNFWLFMDFIIPVGMLGYGIGRIGCFLEGCCYGAITSVPWAVVFPYHPGEWRHPTQLYEMAFGISMFFILKWWNEKRKTFPGQTFLLGLLAYAIERFCVEFIRTNLMYGPFSNAQWISIVIFVAVIVLYRVRAAKRPLAS